MEMELDNDMPSHSSDNLTLDAQARKQPQFYFGRTKAQPGHAGTKLKRKTRTGDLLDVT